MSWSCTGDVGANTPAGFKYSFVRAYKIISLVKTVEKNNILSFCISTLTLNSIVWIS